ncbi:MAG TPA: efflux RND transporter periplasmic adaptor subunit [Myxococcota bacterium]|nr:efflux RND transporter periplasmic adaptor subunit [Myxococcota bacterium]
MSEMRRDVDLAAFARERSAEPVAPKRKRRLALIIPLLLIAGFAAVLFSTLGDLLRGAVGVTVVRPQAAGLGEGGGTAAGSGELTRSGWIEPDPYPLLATALVPGVVKELLALEGDEVAPGQALARLVDDAAKVELARADAALARAQADARKAQVERDLAQQSFDAALEVTEAEASAKAELAGRTAEAAHRVAAAKEARAKVRIAEEELALQRFLAENGGAGPRQVALAEARVDAERAALATMEADAALATSEVAKGEARLARATRERELRLADRLRLETAQASLAVAEAMSGEAAAMRDAAALALERTTVKAPAAQAAARGEPGSGEKLVVLQRLVAPGAMVGTEGREAVCSLFDPRSLRVRVDVEQSEVAKLAVGQRAKVKAPTRPDRLYDAEVVRIVRLANVEKVTLQVHVRIRDPDQALRPEMLVETRFLAQPVPGTNYSSPSRDDPGRGATPPGGDPALGSDPSRRDAGGPPAGAGEQFVPGTNQAVWVPKRVVGREGGGASVWVVDAISGRAARRAIEVDREDGERTLVRSGLNVSDKVIDEGRESLREGARVKIQGESDGSRSSASEGR